MKTPKNSVLFAVICVGITTNSALCQGTVVARHAGADDPTNEGFRLVASYGSPQVGPVINDLGLDAWSIQASAAGVYYERSLASLVGLDWVLSVNMRVVDPAVSPDGLVFGASVTTGQYYFNLRFGSQADHDPMVRATGFLPSQTPVFVLDGAGSSYHLYQLVYSAATETAALWIDGVERYSGLVGGSVSSGATLRWSGGYQGSPGFQANWNEVSLSIIPEPASLALWFWGGGLLVWTLRRNGCAVKRTVLKTGKRC